MPFQIQRDCGRDSRQERFEFELELELKRRRRELASEGFLNGNLEPKKLRLGNLSEINHLSLITQTTFSHELQKELKGKTENVISTSLFAIFEKKLLV